MPDIPINSPLGFTGVTLLLVGILLILAGFNILKVRQQITIASGKKTWGFGIFLAVIGVAFLLLDIASPSSLLSFINTPTPTIPADKRCIGLEKDAVIDGNPVPVSAWQGDCSYSQKIWGGETVVLTTWGIIIEYADEVIVSARTISPGVAVTAPPLSTLFAGYQSREGAEQAYRQRNPDAPLPR